MQKVMNQGMNSDYGKLMATSELAGLKIISDDWCCKLLAWLLVYGGGNESVVQSNMLFVDIITAQTRLNIKGGEMPDSELFLVMKKYVDEIKLKEVMWIEEIESKYNIISRP